ncbi:hypothetical protein DRW48_07385 [Paracoccus suum]|uniref:Uncharacterized protein n=1 Tax=Paracoccus suum TaxID=2259340 RepID=A0A344PJH9_9RHOB|nr:DUF6638 family protein [Paracoccus suum]AXC49534.1 hypothetical protein DRW48_07385 [Paracoccus suum]
MTGVATLIEKGLMFGGLIRVDSPAWVARYNRALQKLIGKQTALSEFHIDLSGTSPEIGDELGDLDYLDPQGGTRQFILLTTEQKTAPLLNVDLSVEREILRRFIVANESQLFTLTARDAVVGEMDEGVWQIASPADLLGIRHLRVTADTTGDQVAQSARLTAMIDRFRTERDAWWDDVLIAQMIEQAQKSGDVTRNPVRLGQTEFEVGDFWTAEFGGVYVIRSAREPAVIFSDKTKLRPLQGAQSLSVDQPHAIAAWLARNGLADSLASTRSAGTAALLRQKIDFILVDAAVRLEIDTGAGTRADLRRAVGRMGDALPPEVRSLSALASYIEHGGDWPVIDSADPAYFYAVRATPGPARDVINMLLAELAPHDVRALFILNKPLFYRLYRGWDAAKQTYVATQLEQEYMLDKQGTRAALFGPEPGMADPVGAPAAPAIVGPWGARQAAATPSPWGPAR